MPDVTVPAAPPLARLANVELVHTGTWNLSTGPATFTVEDLANAVAALDCPAVRRPILKLGHTPDPAPGQPAVGFIANMATADNGRTLVGDYTGMPGWLVDADPDGNSVLSSAYPDRSIEGAFDFRCQLGHTHPFVITAVSLLGQEAPGIGTLQSLQDLADLYGVAAATAPDCQSFTVTVRASPGGAVPNPKPLQVAASVTTEDVRRAFYASPAGACWSTWIEEMQLDPLQLIVVDDDEGTRSRVPVTVGDGDGQAAVTFGDPVPVVIRYDDAPATATAAANAAAGGGQVLRFASRAESRPGAPPKPAAIPPPSPDIPAASAAGTATPRGAASMDPAKIREALDLGPDASEDEVKAAAAKAFGLPTATPAAPSDADPVAVAAKPAAPKDDSGVVYVDTAILAGLRQQAQRGDEAFKQLQLQRRDQILDDAIRAGKFPPARRDHWAMAFDADPDGTEAQIKQLAAGLVPVAAAGYRGADGDYEAEQVYRSLYPEEG